MKSTLMYSLYAIFIISILTGMNGIIGGAASVPGATTVAGAAIDNELRCALVFWVAFGVFCFWVARNIKDRHSFVPFIAVVVLLSGLARLLSVLLVGMPGNPLLAAMIIEFVLFILIYFSYTKWKKIKN